MKKLKIAYPSLFFSQVYIALIKQTIQELGHIASFVLIDDEVDYDILALEPDFSNWQWLDILLRSRRKNPHIPVILVSLDMTVQDGFSPLSEDSSVFLLNDVRMLKKYFHRIQSLLNISPKRILFVDDDTNILKSYERSLRKTSLHLLTVSSAEKAMEILRHEKIDLVVTDIKMPGMHGFTLISKIRKDNKDLPIIVCSAYHGMSEDTDLHFHNVSEFFEKPVNMDILKEKIEAILNKGPGEK